MSSFTSRIRNDYPKLIEELKQNIELFNLWKNENFEDDSSVCAYFVGIRDDNLSQSQRQETYAKERFLSNFILQCIEDDIDVLIAAIKKEKEKNSEVSYD